MPRMFGKRIYHRNKSVKEKNQLEPIQIVMILNIQKKEG